MEIEAKYAASDPRQFSGLIEADNLGKYSLETIEEQDVIDRYMDTIDLDIWESGYACRIREKNGHWLLTVKGPGRVEGAIHRREEYEMEIQPGTQPQQWPDGPIRDLVISLTQSRPLVELCFIRQHRILRSVYRDRRSVGILFLDVVDMGSIGKRENDYEVEIELGEGGTIEDLRLLGKMLRALGLHPELRPKFKRAMELFKKTRNGSVEIS